MNTGKILAPLRKLGLMPLVDKAKFYYENQKNRTDNQQFLTQNPGLKLPPPYMMYEAFQLNYRRYYEGGKSTAAWLVKFLSAYTSLQHKKILDWGCGPARVIRHFPELIGPESEYFGTDYNAETIAWCQANISKVTFAHNHLDPPTVFPDSTFDVVYGISIFTHLSEENHSNWYHELIRITKPGGIMLVTTSGEAFKAKLTDPEKVQFDKGQLVTRANIQEGHRGYAAFQPPAFLQHLFQPKATILVHKPGQKVSWGLEQDIWVLQKK